MKIKLLWVYQKEKPSGVKIKFDSKNKKRPAWIKILNPNIRPGFLRVRINKRDEVIYRAFGEYFYPIDASDQEQKMFMAGIAQGYDAVTTKNNLPWARLLAEKLEKHGLPKTARVIDLGAGTGTACLAMAEKGYRQLTLLDFCPEMLQRAKKKPALAQARFLVADIKKLNLKEKFGAVISVMVFDDIKPESELEKVLTKVRAIMNSEALIAVIDDSKKAVYSRLFTKIEDGKTKPTKASDLTRYYFIGKKT